MEALRLGCETYTNDYNPVAVLIEKCTLEYPQKYGHRLGKNEKWGELSGAEDNPLLTDIKKWAQWVFDETNREIGQFYPNEKDESVVVGYIWAKTIPCQNPTCGKQIPLFRQYWLAKRKNKKVSLFPFKKNGNLKFSIVGDGYDKIPENFNPNIGTISRAVVHCPYCNSSIDGKTTRRLFQERKSNSLMVAVVYKNPNEHGKKYRTATNDDYSTYLKAKNYLEEKEPILHRKWGIEPIPNEEFPRSVMMMSEPLGSAQNYNIYTWGDLYNSRQKLALITIIEKIKSIYTNNVNSEPNQDYLNAIILYLAFAVDRLASFSTNLCRWKSSSEQNIPLFSGRNALPIVFDYFEVAPLGEISTTWTKCVDIVLESFNIFENIQQRAVITNYSATSLSYPDGFFDSILTDPPYYDNIPYSYLSDFFYVWLKRTIGELYPDLFSTALVPKKQEIVAYSKGPRGEENGKQVFEDLLKKSFQEIFRILKTNGISVIVYAHKSTSGWETLINSLLDSGLIVTGAWPINTEMEERMNAMETAALTSSIYLIARKMERQPTGFYNNVKDELKIHLNKKLERLWQEGISGADFFIAAIGSAIEVFGKYEQVMDFEGNIVRADRLLIDVRKIATDFAVRQILHNGFVGEISDLARFYVLWRWNYGEAKVPFDEARKLGQSCGIDVSQEWSHQGFVKKEKEFVRLIGPQERKIEDLEGSQELIDVLHQILLLWEKSKRDQMVKILQETGYGKSEAFYRVAQAISETLTNESKEKKLLDGFLAGRERLTEEVRKETTQTRLGV